MVSSSMAGCTPPPRSLETSHANPMRCSRLMRIQCAAPPQGLAATKEQADARNRTPGLTPPIQDLHPTPRTETKRLATGNENPTWQARVVYAKMVAGCFRSTAKGTSRAEVPRSMVGTRLFRVPMRAIAWGSCCAALGMPATCYDCPCSGSGTAPLPLRHLSLRP